MVTGAADEGGQEAMDVDKLLADLDRFTSTPTGGLTIILLTALLRLLVPAAVRRRARRKVDKSPKAAHNA